MTVEAWLSVRDIQARLGISKAHAWFVMRQMPILRSGRVVRVRESDFNTWVQRHTEEPA